MLAVTHLAGFGARRTPFVTGRASYIAGSAVSTHNVTLPSSIQADDLLLLVLCTLGSVTITSVSGWTQLFANAASLSRNVYLASYYRRATGSEGSTAAVGISSSNSSVLAFTWRVKDAIIPEAGTVATASGVATDDPPALSPSPGAAPTLFIAAAQHTESANSLSSYPSGYGQGQNIATGNSLLAVAERTARTTSENPGVFTWSGNGSSIANTIAIAAA